MKIKLSQPLGIHELGARDNQEDSIYPLLGKASTNSRLFLVCDGMGGHEGGEVASNAVCLAMSNYFNSHFNGHEEIFKADILSEALKAAYAELDKRDNGQVSKMGTTLTLVLVHRGGVIAAHIGDSRIYHLRPATSEILYKSRDHSLINDLVDAGEMTRAEANVSSRKNIITRALMPRESRPVRPEVAYITDVKPGDYFYLCSDGMLEQMDDRDILNLLSDKYESNETKRDRLINATTENRDNHSAYILQVEAVEAEPGDAEQPDNEAHKSYDDSVMAEDVDDGIQVVMPTPQSAPTAPPAAPFPQPQMQAQPQATIPTPAPGSQAVRKPWALIALAAMLAALLVVGAVMFFSKKDPTPRPKKIEQVDQQGNAKSAESNGATKNTTPSVDYDETNSITTGNRPVQGTPPRDYQGSTTPKVVGSKTDPEEKENKPNATDAAKTAVRKTSGGNNGQKATGLSNNTNQGSGDSQTGEDNTTDK